MKFLFALCTVVFGIGSGAAVGFGLESTPMASHLFWDEIICGAVAGFVSATVANQALEIPAQHRPVQRAASVAIYGAVMGLLVATIWYGFDWDGSLALVGGVSGFLSGMPAASAYGLLIGGEPRALGVSEFANLMSCLGLGLVVAFILLDDYDLGTMGAVAATCAAIPAIFGGRINPWEYLGD